MHVKESNRIDEVKDNREMEVKKDSKIMHGLEESDNEIEANRVDKIKDKIESNAREVRKPAIANKSRATNRNK